MAPREVFLSHAHQDRGFASRLAETLIRHAVPVWYSPTRIQGAQQGVLTMPPSAEQIAGFADYLSQSARTRLGEERAETLRAAIPQAAEYLAIVSSFPVDPEDEPCLRSLLPDSETPR